MNAKEAVRLRRGDHVLAKIKEWDEFVHLIVEGYASDYPQSKKVVYFWCWGYNLPKELFDKTKNRFRISNNDIVMLIDHVETQIS